MKVGAVVLAAGSGTRLNGGVPSEKPKVLYEIAGRPMVAYTLGLLKKLQIEDVVMVVGYKAELVKEVFVGQAEFAVQAERFGTAHAAKIGIERLGKDISSVLVIQGDDSAFYRPETIAKLLEGAKSYKFAFTTVSLPDPGAYGRVLRDQEGAVSAIVEKEALTPDQRLIKEVNAATYFVDRGWFEANYPRLKPSKVGKGEIIMPDFVELTVSRGEKVLGYPVPKEEWVGVNTPEELALANQLMQERLHGN